MTVKWSAAVARARDGFVVFPRPTVIVRHLVTVTPRPQLDGALLYAAECSCRNWLCTDAATDAEARERSKEHANPDVIRFGDRSEQQMRILRKADR